MNLQHLRQGEGKFLKLKRNFAAPCYNPFHAADGRGHGTLVDPSDASRPPCLHTGEAVIDLESD